MAFKDIGFENKVRIVDSVNEYLSTKKGDTTVVLFNLLFIKNQSLTIKR